MKPTTAAKSSCRKALGAGLSCVLLCVGWITASPEAVAGELEKLQLSPSRLMAGRSVRVAAPEAAAPPRKEQVRVWSPEDASATRFYHGRLLPRFERQFGQLGRYRWAEQAGQPLTENIIYDDVNKAVQKSLERATRRAIEDYLVEETSLRFVIDSLEQRRNDPARGRQDRKRAVRFDVDISHGLPEVEMRTQIAGARVKFEVGLDGRFGVAYSSPRSGSAYVRAKIDPFRSNYSLNTHFSF